MPCVTCASDGNSLLAVVVAWFDVGAASGSVISTSESGAYSSLSHVAPSRFPFLEILCPFWIAHLLALTRFISCFATLAFYTLLRWCTSHMRARKQLRLSAVRVCIHMYMHVHMPPLGTLLLSTQVSMARFLCYARCFIRTYMHTAARACWIIYTHESGST